MHTIPGLDWFLYFFSFLLFFTSLLLPLLLHFRLSPGDEATNGRAIKGHGWSEVVVVVADVVDIVVVVAVVAAAVFRWRILRGRPAGGPWAVPVGATTSTTTTATFRPAAGPSSPRWPRCWLRPRRCTSTRTPDWRNWSPAQLNKKTKRKPEKPLSAIRFQWLFQFGSSPWWRWWGYIRLD